MDAKKTGQFICKLRKEKNLTQAALAERLSISNRTVSKWENGDGMPDISTLPELAGALGVSVDELLDGQRDEKRADIKVEEIASRDNLDNIFLISYIAALFIGIFAAVLGGATEIYSLCFFKVLFYTHWEVMFAAISLFAVILSGLIFSIGAARLSVSYSPSEVKKKISRKVWLLSLILGIFPLTFLLRAVNWVFGIFHVPFTSLALLIPMTLGYVFAFFLLYRKFAVKG